MNTGITTIPLDTSDAFVALHARRNFTLNVIKVRARDMKSRQ